jgi:hypothetical protein
LWPGAEAIMTSWISRFTREIQVMMANIEARMQLLAAVPGACRTLVECSLGTDDIEGEFALLVFGCGYKPTPQMAAEYLKRVDFLHHMRRQGGPDYGLVVPKSTKSVYTYHDAAAKGDASWNDGQLLADPAVRTRMLERVLHRALNVLGQTREAAVRSHHAM